MAITFGTRFFFCVIDLFLKIVYADFFERKILNKICSKKVF
jgi:hypothetical protein